MELLTSKKFKLPTVYFITDRNTIKDIPVGVPFIFGEQKDKEHIVRILEYEILYQEAIRSGYPFDFRRILLENGYEGLNDCSYSIPAYMDYVTEDCDYEESSDWDIEKKPIGEDTGLFNTFIRDSAVYVDIAKLKDLNVFPIWLDTIENAIHTNIHNFAVYNPNMYNKKLEGMYGGVELSPPSKNLIIIDISGSIPKGVSATCLALAKNLVQTFYADLIITGSISTLYHYEEIHDLDINTIYDVNGMNNEQLYFKKILSNDIRHYKTGIVFGDNHSPCDGWQGESSISRYAGKKLCKWTIDKLISFHTTSNTNIAGYADWFEPKEVEKITNWVQYLNKVN